MYTCLFDSLAKFPLDMFDQRETLQNDNYGPVVYTCIFKSKNIDNKTVHFWKMYTTRCVGEYLGL